MTRPRRLLIIDDSVTIRALIEQIFSTERLVDIVGIVDSGETAIAILKASRPDIITLDIMLPGIDGFAVLDHIMATCPAPVIVISSAATAGSELCRKAIDHGASSCFDKAKVVSEAGKLRSDVLKAKRGKVAPVSGAEPH